MEYFILSIFFHATHSGLVLFMLFGLFFSKLIKFHFFFVIVIWISWLAIGSYYGVIGYCPLTEWHWQVLVEMGEVNLPPSYIEYVYTKITGQDVNNNLMSDIIAAVMIVITLVSGFRFFRLRESHIS